MDRAATPHLIRTEMTVDRRKGMEEHECISMRCVYVRERACESV